MTSTDGALSAKAEIDAGQAAAEASPLGFSEAEARARRARGEGNDVHFRSSRSVWSILRANLFTFFNQILFAIGVALVALGEVNDALTSVGLGLVNAVIGAAQELRAKRQLDRIALLNRPVAVALRDGVERSIDPREIVRGDVLVLRPGDQVSVDGVMVGDGALEMDESLLTGESRPIRKRAGDTLLSGSVCLSGGGLMRAEKVGANSFANRLTAAARSLRLTRTPLQRQVDATVRLVMLVVALIGGIILLAALLDSLPALRIVQLAAVLSGQVPYGLFFMIVVAYAMGAAAIARRGALIQQINAIESLSGVDVLCMDKTGTLTANALTLKEIRALGALPQADLERRLGVFARSASAANRTAQALAAALPGERRATTREVAFDSTRKWSALAFADADMAGLHVLGAPEILAPRLRFADDAARTAFEAALSGWTAQGLRVLAFARADEESPTVDDETPALPPLEPLGLIAVADALRPQAQETLRRFAALGLRLKVISGDEPGTVAALARQAGIDARSVVSGLELERMTPAERAEAAERADVFGRVTPAQKEAIVDALAAKGRRVAMMGDGVNDVPSLKKAHLAIAMQSGAQAARNVADIVLLNDSFAALSPAFSEGQRIVAAMGKALYLFLTRVAISILTIVAITMLGLSFPFEPAQVALTVFTVGIPSFFLTLWARPAPQPANLYASLARFVFPAAILTMVFGVGVYAFMYERVLASAIDFEIPERGLAQFERATGLTIGDGVDFQIAAATIMAQSCLSIFISYAAFLLILFLEPPARLFAGWAAVSPDRRPAWLTLALAATFAAVAATPASAGYFGLVTPGTPILLGMAAALILWALLLRTAWRRRWFERLFGMEAGAAPVWREPLSESKISKPIATLDKNP